MKNLNPVYWLFVVLLITACNNNKESTADKKDSNSATTAETKNNSGDNIITFSVNGETVTSSAWNISRFDFGNGAGTCVNITSNMHQDPRSINVNINGDKAGTYTFENEMLTVKKPGVAYGSYAPDYLKDMSNKYSFKEGNFTISSIDTTAGIFNGTFSGTAKNSKGEAMTISDGKVINGKIKAGVVKLY